jgi:probable DNA repair protein
LDLAGWPGFRPLSSIAFQVRERWERVLEDCASLGFDENDGSMEWDECIATLSDAVAETVFAAESGDARILITGPLESAGQLADGIWFLGADEEAWPGRGQPHPLLPIGLQRDAAMPHSSPQADWALAQQATARLIASGEEVVFSYAKQSSDAESRPSRLALQFLGEPETASLAENLPRDDRTEQFADTSLVPFPHRAMQGGAATLTDQSNCPFKAFATARMDARDWEPATAGLNPRQRGILLHAVLHRIWGGSTRKGIATHAELMAISDLRDFVANHVLQIMRENFDQTRSSALPDRFPARYLELESKRLTSLVAEWLDYERARVPFAVIETEIDTEVAVAGLTFKLRLDRIDAVGEGDKIVIDYKSSDKGPNMWAGERPEDVQLPLYATFAIAGGLEGLLIGQVRPSSPKLSGRVRNAKSTLFAGLSGSSGLVKAPLNETQLNEWRLRIEQLGEDFLAGHAEVDPREPGKTCESCHLQAVCRINENDPLRTSGTDEEEESAGEDDHA